MERKIGETFEFEGKKIKVTIAINGECDGCILDGKCTRTNKAIVGKCGCEYREDMTSVKFVEVQEQQAEEPKERKIGETFDYEGKTLQVKESEHGSCGGCFFDGKCYSLREEVAGNCEAVNRGDNKEVIFMELQEQPQEQTEQQTEQPQGLNLCEILKYCPDGETFWSPMLGDVKFYGIELNRKLVNVIIENGETWDINADGTITFGNVTSPEIMLYPSREQRDWTQVKYETKLPTTWEEFCKNYPRKKDEAYFDMNSQICIFSQDYEYRSKDKDKNLLPSKQAAEAHLALMQLHQLRDAWREGWLPDWNDGDQNKYVIAYNKGEFEIWKYQTISRFLAFQDEKRADEFKDCFIDLIKQAGDLI